MLQRPLIVCLLPALLCTLLSAQRPYDTRSLSPVKTRGAILVDGVLNEPDWQSAPVANEFWQQYPFDSSQARTQTEVRMLYDDKALYIAAVCYDTFPGKYVIESLRRDFNWRRNDCFLVHLDTYNDKFSGFSFGVSPYGVQREGLIENGGNFDGNLRWDNKWFCEVKQVPGAWIAEIKIPFKTIRYKAGNTVWRINFARNNQKINEISVWNRVPFNFPNTSLAYTGILQWEEPPPRPGINLSLIPYAIGGVNHSYTGDQTKWIYNGGGDAKIALTSSLNLDLTFNPDFSQVDADAQITNLTRFSLFFPEQRQFFLENSDLFEKFGFSKIRPFFSRRIGLFNGQQVPIIYGLRLSGKLHPKVRIGAMNIQTARSETLGLEAQNYSVGALQWQAFGRSALGLIFVNRQGFDGDHINPDDYNRVVGIDYDLQTKDNKWLGKFFFHHSISPKNNYNAMAHASFLRYSDTHWFIMWNHEYVGRNYNAQMGFVPRQHVYNSITDSVVHMAYWRLEPQVEYSFYPKSKKVYRVAPGVYNSTYADSMFRPNDVHLKFYLDVEFFNTSFFNAEYNEYYTYLMYPTDITGTGNTPLPAGAYHYRDGLLYYNSNLRKRFNFTSYVTFGSFYNGTKLSYGLTLRYRAQPWGNFSINFTRDEIWLPDPYGESHLMLISPRIDITFRRNIFWTTFVQFNSQIDNISINSRFQWRFAPMSDLFVVYTDDYGSQKWNVKNRGVVVKLVYWITI